MECDPSFLPVYCYYQELEVEAAEGLRCVIIVPNHVSVAVGML
jgi:hypothetical protein